MSDLEIMAIVPESSYDGLVSSLFINEAEKVNIRIDKINKPQRRFKGSIGSTVKELVENVFLSKGSNMNEVLVSMLLEASVVAGKLEVQDTLKRELDTLMGTLASDVKNAAFRRFLTSFSESSSGLVNPEKPFYFGDFVQWKMENWKLQKAEANMQVLKRIASGEQTKFDIKAHLYRGLQTSIQLLSYYAASEDMMSKGGGSKTAASGKTPSGPSGVSSLTGENEASSVVPKRKVRGIVASKTIETLGFCARVEGLEGCSGLNELQTIVALRVAAHNYYGAENDNVRLPDVRSAEEMSRHSVSRGEGETAELDDMMGTDKPPYVVPMSMVSKVYQAVVVSGALQATWMTVSSESQKILNDRDQFIAVFSREFERRLEEWKTYVPDV